jgi:hypothetical protein
MGIELDAEIVPSPILSSRRDQSGSTIFNDFETRSASPSLPTTCEHRDAPTAGQSTLSAAIPLFGDLIPLLGCQNSAVRQSSGIPPRTLLESITWEAQFRLRKPRISGFSFIFPCSSGIRSLSSGHHRGKFSQD